jgi:hypothetical protein
MTTPVRLGLVRPEPGSHDAPAETPLGVTLDGGTEEAEAA